MVEGKRSVPIGNDFLKSIRTQELRCEGVFVQWLPNAGVKAPKTMEALGTALSYLDRIATCWWGCRQGAHIEESLVARATSNGRAALQLLRMGYYDEALGLIRQIGETANLAFLLAMSPEKRSEWLHASEKGIRRNYAPPDVRRELEKLDLPAPMDRATYGDLSERFIHVNPGTSPQSHNTYGVPTLGGYFQEAGTMVALNELGIMVAMMLHIAIKLVDPPTSDRAAKDASRALIDSVGSVDLRSIVVHFDKIRATPQFRQDSELLRQRQLDLTFGNPVADSHTPPGQAEGRGHASSAADDNR